MVIFIRKAGVYKYTTSDRMFVIVASIAHRHRPSLEDWNKGWGLYQTEEYARVKNKAAAKPVMTGTFDQCVEALTSAYGYQPSFASSWTRPSKQETG